LKFRNKNLFQSGKKVKTMSNQFRFKFPNKGISTLIGILIIVLIAIIIGGGILVWWRLEMPKEEVKIPQVKTPKEEAKDETADWKTYQNEEYGFEFRYPSNIEKLGLVKLKEILASAKISTSSEKYENCEFIIPGIHKTAKGEKRKIGEINFCVLPKEDHGPGTISVDYTFIGNLNGKYFTVELSGTYPSEGWCKGLPCKDFSWVKETFEKMLSTFRFAEKIKSSGGENKNLENLN